MGLIWRYNIYAITENRFPIEGTLQTGITIKSKAWEMAIEYFKTVKPKPYRVVLAPKLYKVNGRLIDRTNMSNY
jgi:hypothetical protein